jgi:hypothetical protein
MTTLLNEAFKKASRLPESIQDEIASQLIEDIENEIGWETAFEETQDKLDKLAEKALRDFNDGRVTKMGFDEL